MHASGQPGWEACPGPVQERFRTLEERTLDEVGRRDTEKPRRPPVLLSRGGVEGGSEGLDCRVVDGEIISAWLDDAPEYLQHLKTL